MKLKKEVKIILAVIALFIIGFIGIKAFGSKSADHDQPVSEATAITETAEEGKQENAEHQFEEDENKTEEEIMAELEAEAPEIYVPEGTIEPMEPQTEGDITIEEGQHGSF